MEGFLLKESQDIIHSSESEFDHFVQTLLFQDQTPNSSSTPASTPSSRSYEDSTSPSVPFSSVSVQSPSDTTFHPVSSVDVPHATPFSFSLKTEPTNNNSYTPPPTYTSIDPPPHAPIPSELSNKLPPPSYKALSSRNVHRRTLLHGPIWGKALEKMGLLIDIIRDLVQADIGTLFLHDNNTNELYSHVTHPQPIEIAIPSYLGIAGAVFQSGKTINCSSAYMDPRFYSGIDRQTGTPTLAILAVPIFSSETGKTIGVIELLNKKRKTTFNEENEKEVFMICRMVAKIIEKAAADVKQESEKKGVKRPAEENEKEMSTSSTSSSTSSSNSSSSSKKRRARDRNTIPVFHFKTPKQHSKEKKKD